MIDISPEQTPFPIPIMSTIYEGPNAYWLLGFRDDAAILWTYCIFAKWSITRIWRLDPEIKAKKYRLMPRNLFIETESIRQRLSMIDSVPLFWCTVHPLVYKRAKVAIERGWVPDWWERFGVDGIYQRIKDNQKSSYFAFIDP